MNARIGFKPQVTTTPGFHSLHNWCFQMMWLFSGAPEDPEDDTVMEKHRTDVLYSAVKGLKHAIRTEDQDAQLDAPHWMIQIAQPWTKSRWSESTLANGKPLVRILKENPHLVDFELTVAEHSKRKTVVKRYTSQGTSEARRVRKWRLASSSFILGDTEDLNDVSGQWYNDWPLDSWVDTLILQRLRDTFQPILVNTPAEYPKPDEDEALNELLLYKPEWHESPLTPKLPS